MNIPMLSIICPVYNAEKYLKRLYDSLARQSYGDYELIFVNDGSTDGSMMIIEELARKDNRVKLISQKNQGIARARNRGIEVARGEYLMFVDNDDYVEGDFLDEYVKKIDADGADMVIGGYKRIDSLGKVVDHQRLKKDSAWAKYIIMAPWAKIYRRKFIIDNRIEFLDYIGEDIYFNLSCYDKNPKIEVLETEDYVWYYNERSFSNTNKNKGAKSNIDVVRLFDCLNDVADFDDCYVRYFLKRYEVWYLFFLSQNSTKEELIKQYNIMNKYLEKKGIKKVMNPFSIKLRGERLKNRVAVFCVVICEKMHIINWMLKRMARI